MYENKLYWTRFWKEKENWLGSLFSKVCLLQDVKGKIRGAVVEEEQCRWLMTYARIENTGYWKPKYWRRIDEAEDWRWRCINVNKKWLMVIKW